MIKIKTLEINSQQFILDSDIEKGFLKGSIWENLYSGYKYVVTSIDGLSEEDKLMFILQVYTFASTELTLFVCTHPDSIETIETLKKVNIEKNNLTNYIESKYGALKACSVEFAGFLERKNTWEGDK